MLLELSVIPLGRGPSLSQDIAEAVKMVDASGLDYRLTSTGTLIEGNLDELMDLAKKCHLSIRRKTIRVVTFIKIDDYDDRKGRLTSAVKSVEEKVGKEFKK